VFGFFAISLFFSSLAEIPAQSNLGPERLLRRDGGGINVDIVRHGEVPRPGS
jgi:hypothetical protein